MSVRIMGIVALLSIVFILASAPDAIEQTDSISASYKYPTDEQQGIKDGKIISNPDHLYILWEDGKEYELAEDIHCGFRECIKIVGKDITLDGNGKEIFGNINLEGAKKIHLKNMLVDPDYGIILNNTDDSVYSNIDYTNITIYGIWLYNDSNNNTFNNITINTSGSGVLITNDSDGNHFNNLTININTSPKTAFYATTGTDFSDSATALSLDSYTHLDVDDFDHDNLTLDSKIYVNTSGTYRVFYSSAHYSQTITSNRGIVEQYLTKNGSQIIPSNTTNYNRRYSGTDDLGDQAGSSAATLVDIGDGDYIELFSTIQDGDDDGATSRPQETWVLLEKLDADSAQVYATTAQGGASVTDVAFAAQTRVDTDTFSHSTSTNNERVYVNKTGWYKLSYSCSYYGDAGNRHIVQNRIAINSTPYTPSLTRAYMRGADDTNGPGHSNSNQGATLAYLYNNSYVKLQAYGSKSTTQTEADKCWLTLEEAKRPSIQVYDSAGSQDLSSGATAIDFGSRTKMDAVFFNHSTSTDSSRVYVNVPGWYKLTYTTGFEQGSPTINKREIHRSYLMINGADEITPSATRTYLRAQNNGHQESNYAETMAYLDSGDYVQVYVDRVTGSDDDLRTIADESWLIMEKLEDGHGIQIISGQDNKVDCKGSSLKGPDTPQSIAFYSEEQNSTLTNCTISGFDTAINLSGATDSSIYGNNLTASTWVYDSAGTGNNYNTTIGNIYYFENNTPSWEVYNVFSTDADYWSDAGGDLPFDSSLSGGEWVGSGEDNRPWSEAEADYPPLITSVSITPNTPYANDTIYCSVTAIDNKTSSLDVEYNWYLNGAFLGHLSGTGSVLNNTDTSISTLGSSDFSHMRTINLSSATPTDEYQVEVRLNTSTFGDPYDNMQEDGGDIRFYDDQGNSLDHWRAYFNNSGESFFWVKTEKQGTEQIIMIYGNDSVSSESNITATFSYSEPRTVAYPVGDTLLAGSLKIMSLCDNNTIEIGTNTYLLNYTNTTTVSSGFSRNTPIKATCLLHIDGSVDGTDIVTPVSWASDDFTYRQDRDGSVWSILSPWGTATVDIYDGTSSTASSPYTVTSVGTSFTDSVADSNAFSVESTIPVLVFFHSTNDVGDSMSLYPSTSDYLYGVASENIEIGGGPSGASYSYSTSSTYTETTGSLSSGSSYEYQFGTTGWGDEPAVRVYATSGLIGAHQLADSDGREATTFLPRQMMGTRFGANNPAGYIVIAAPTPNTNITVYYPNATVYSSTTGGSRTNVNKIGFGTGDSSTILNAGWYMETDAPVYAYYENDGTGDTDETNLWTHPMMRQYSYPDSTVSSISEQIQIDIERDQNWTCSVRVNDGSSDSDWNNATALIIPMPGEDCTLLDSSFSDSTITMLNNISSESQTCYNITGDNITLDCDGYSITGDDSEDTYGIQVEGDDTTLKNCNISGFHRIVNIDSADDANLENNTLNCTYAGGFGLFLTNSADYANISSNTFISGSSQTAIYIEPGSDSGLYCHNNITTGVWITDYGTSNSFNCTDAGNIYYDYDGTAGWLDKQVYDLDSDGYSDAGADLPFDSSFSQIYGNAQDYHPYTQYNQTDNDNPQLIQINITPEDAYSYSSIYCNITAIDNETSSLLVFYEWYKNGVNQTDLNGSAVVSNNTNTAVSSVDPQNLSKGDNWSCSAYAYDYVEYSQYLDSDNKTIFGANPKDAQIVSITNSSTGHSLVVNASVVDTDGADDIISTNISSSTGNCIYLSNSTDANTLYVEYNCSYSPEPSSTDVVIGFNDSDGFYNQTTVQTVQYPDNAATLTQPLITPNPAYANSTLTCNNGTFSDVDGDTENISARAYVWYKNGQEILGQTTNTLSEDYFESSDEIICGQSATASNWTDSTDTTNSTSVTISNTASENATILSITNCSAGHCFIVNASVDDMDGGDDIISSNISTNHGECEQISNSTDSNTFNISYNCSATNPGPATFYIGFTDSGSTYIQTTTGSNSYIDHPLTLGQTYVTPGAPSTSSDLTCNAGAFLDPDSDIENISSRTYRWFINGVQLPGQTDQILGYQNTNGGDNVSCEINTTAQNWTSSNDSSQSENISIISTPLGIVQEITFSNMTDHWFYANATVTDEDGGDDIVYTGASSTVGSCTQVSNSTISTDFSVVFNCTGTVLSQTYVNITFNDSTSQTISTSDYNTIPNYPPTTPTNLDPEGGEQFTRDASNNISINWTGSTDQDTMDNITYYIYYSNDSGLNWHYLTDQETTDYWWNTTSLASLSTYRVRVYSNDTFQSSDNITSSDFEILHNTRPDITNIRILPSQVDDYSDMSCEILIEDSEDTELNVSYRWYKNGILQAGLSATTNITNATAKNVSTIDNSYLSVGDNWSCSANATDGHMDSDAKNSTNITVDEGTELVAYKDLISGDTVYNLSSNLSYDGTKIRFMAQNITLDCQGLSLIGDSISDSKAIEILADGAKLHNCDIVDFGIDVEIRADGAELMNNTLGTPIGIILNSSSNGLYQNNTFSNITDKAIYITNGSNNNTFTDFNISTSGLGHGIYIDSGENNSFDCSNRYIIGTNSSSTYAFYSEEDNNSLSNCRIEGFYYGINLFSSSSSEFADLNISTTHSTGKAIYLSSSSNSNLFEDMEIDTHSSSLKLDSSDDNVFDNIDFDSEEEKTIELISSINNTINNSDVSTKDSYSIYLSSSSSNTIQDSFANASYYPLYLTSNSDQNKILGSTFNVTNDYGIKMISADSNNLTNNTINAFNYAIHLDSSDSNTLEDNIISSTFNYALRLDSSSSNNITENNLSAGATGTAYYSSSGSDQNRVFGNEISAQKWISDQGSSNMYNDSDSGNIYRYFSGAGAWSVYDITYHPYDGDYWADFGDDLPFDQSISQWDGAGEDNHPYTESLSAPVVEFSDPTQANGTNITYPDPFVANVSVDRNASSCVMEFNDYTVFGTGDDGDLTVDSQNTIVNNYTYLTADASNGTKVLQVYNSSEFIEGGEILIHQTQNSSNGTAGQYEYATISSIDGDNLSLTAELVGTYHTGSFDTTSATVTQIVSVPHFDDVIVEPSASITAKAWDGYSGGIVAFRVFGTLNASGGVNVSQRGYRGGTCGACDDGDWGMQGEGYTGKGTGVLSRNNIGGGGGYGPTSYYGDPGGSGGHATSGAIGDSAEGNDAEGGNTIGSSDLSTMFFGGGGGAGGDNDGHTPFPEYTDGGGIIVIHANIVVDGKFYSDGEDAKTSTTDSGGKAGAGAGGTIWIRSYNMTLINISANGGSNVTQRSDVAGPGGDGRIRLDYSYISGNDTASPIAYENSTDLTPTDSYDMTVNNNSRDTWANYSESGLQLGLYSYHVTCSYGGQDGSTVDQEFRVVAPECPNINTSNYYYQLEKDIYSSTTCVNITADNATVDCAGFSISGANVSGFYGIFSNASNTNIVNCTINDFAHAIRFEGVQTGKVTNTTTDISLVDGYGISIDSSSNSINITNNTLLGGPSTTGVYVSPDSSSIYFYENNITSGYWIENYLSSTEFDVAGKGNYYHLENGTASWEVYDFASNDGDNWSDYGYEYPFNASLEQWTGNGQDDAPYTLLSNITPKIVSQISFTNTTAHEFYANATAEDLDGASDILSIYAYPSNGSCDQYSNSTSGNNVSVVFNCSGTAFENTSVTISFIDSANNNASTSNNNSYPNGAPSVDDASILPSPIYKITEVINCTNGSATDPDGDPISFYYLWYINDSSTGITTFNLTNSSFNKGDNITCQLTPSDGYENGSAVNSTSVVVSNSLPNIQNMSLTSLLQNEQVYCRANVTDGDGLDDLQWVNFTIIDPDGQIIINNTNGTYDGDTYFRSGFFNLSLWGNYTCNVTAIDYSDASVTLTGNFTVIKEWQNYYGDTQGLLQLGDSQKEFFRYWTTEDGKSVFVAEETAMIDFNNLIPLGICPNESFHTGPGINDFTQADSALGISGESRLISEFYDSNDDSYGDSLETFDVFRQSVDNVPSAKINETSPFSTGIFWQANPLQPDVCYNGVQDLVFGVEINISALGTFGISDYELMIPTELATYKGNDEVALYGEYQ